MMHRRDLLQSAIGAGAVSMLASDFALSSDEHRPPNIIDTNVSLFQWPFRRLPLDAPNLLVAKLRTLGISAAWAGSFEGLLQRDITGVNERLAEVCRLHPELVPIGSINLALPNWEDDLRFCIEKHGMPGVRIHPNYHEYTLSDPRFGRLLSSTTKAGCFVQIAVAMEDTRTQHALMQVSDVDLTPLPNLMRENDGARVQLLNVRPPGTLVQELAQAPGVFFDTSRVDGTDGIAKLVRSVPRGRVLFGTHAPFLIPEAALIRVDESGLDEQEVKLLMSEGAGQMRKVVNG